MIAWQALRGVRGTLRVPDHFINFAVKRTGRFGNPFEPTTPLADGTKRHYDYPIAGRLKKSNAKGTLQVKVAQTDPAGAATDL